MKVIDSLTHTDFCFFSTWMLSGHGRSTYKPRIRSRRRKSINIGLVILHALALGTGVSFEKL